MDTSKIKLDRTLVISPNWIGDAVMAQPLLHKLKLKNPHRPIDVMAPAWVAPVWSAMAEVDTMIEAPFRHGALQLKERFKFAKLLKLRGYDAAYVLPNTLKFALIPWLAGIPKRVGYKGESRYGLINVMHHDNPAVPRPMVRFYAALADKPALDIASSDGDLEPQMYVAQEKASEALSRLEILHSLSLNESHTNEYIVLAPGGEYGPAKRWPVSHFIDLANLILKNQRNTKVLLLGSDKDKQLCEQIVAAVPEVLNMAGVTSLSDAIALISRCSAVVTNDSGLMHIACALQRPVVAIFGPTNPMHTPPLSKLAQVLWLNLDCAPCQKRECPLSHNNCMKEISPSMVWEPLKSVLSRTGSPHALIEKSNKD